MTLPPPGQARASRLARLLALACLLLAHGGRVAAQE